MMFTCHEQMGNNTALVDVRFVWTYCRFTAGATEEQFRGKEAIRDNFGSI